MPLKMRVGPTPFVANDPQPRPISRDDAGDLHRLVADMRDGLRQAVTDSLGEMGYVINKHKEKETDMELTNKQEELLRRLLQRQEIADSQTSRDAERQIRLAAALAKPCDQLTAEDKDVLRSTIAEGLRDLYGG